MIEAQEMLSLGKVSFWPHIKHDSYSEQHRALHKLAYPDLYEKEKKFITPEDLQSFLSRGTK